MESTPSIIEKKLQEIDISKISVYEKKISDLSNLNKMMAGVYLRDFIMAFDLASMSLARASQLAMDAKHTLEQKESIAYLDKASEYLKEKGIKDTADARKQYIDIDKDVIEAKNIYSMAEAMASLLKNKTNMFKMAHDDCKKILYGNDAQTGFEGF